MKYGTKEIKDLWDTELLIAYNNCKQQELKREEASKHIKFNHNTIVNGKTINKMEFPPPNSAFIELKKALLNEIKIRKLKV